MSKIDNPDMTTKDLLVAMAEGNPGAITVMIAVLEQAEAIDPKSALKGFGAILSLDSLKIYGPRIWQLYKDVCQESILNLLAVLRAYQLGQLAGTSEQAINKAIDNHGSGLPKMETILAAVRKELPDFGVMPEEGSNEHT